MSKEWRLTRGGELLAVLRPDGRSLMSDQQAAEGTYETAPAFEPLRHLFERECALLDVDSEEENDEWADIWEELCAPGLFVESPDGLSRIDVLWVHFKDGRAWWFPLMRSPKTVIREA